MSRMNEILNEVAKAAGEKYGGTKRSELKDSDFLFPETRSFPIVTPQDVPDAISNFGRMKGQMSYDTFLRKLYNKIKNKPAFVAALPEASKEQLGLKKKATKAYIGNTDTDMMTDPSYTNFYELDRVNMASLKKGDRVRNINSSCKHYGSEGYVEDIEELPDYMGDVVIYKTSNAGDNWNQGDLLKKTRNQLAIVKEKKDLTSADSHDNLKSQSTTDDNTLSSQTEKTPDEENTEYLDEVTPSNSGDKPGLWDNIRKKKEKMGKNYRPAKPGDKDRPDPTQWKKLTK